MKKLYKYLFTEIPLKAQTTPHKISVMEKAISYTIYPRLCDALMSLAETRRKNNKARIPGLSWQNTTKDVKNKSSTGLRAVCISPRKCGNSPYYLPATVSTRTGRWRQNGEGQREGAHLPDAASQCCLLRLLVLPGYFICVLQTTVVFSKDHRNTTISVKCEALILLLL